MSKKIKKVIRDWDEITEDLEKMSNMSCKPTGHKLHPDTVIDEDKSVKWNREYVKEHNEKYAQEVKDLNTKKNKWRDELHEEILNKISKELDITTDKAKEVWNYAREISTGSYYSTINKVEDLIELISKILKEG